MGKNIWVLEKEIEKTILEFINLNPGCHAQKINTTGIPDSKKGILRTIKNPYILKGRSDILSFIYGIPLWIEVKTPKELDDLLSLKTKKTIHQIEQSSFLNLMNRFGCYTIYASSIKMVEEEIKLIESQIMNGSIRTELSDSFLSFIKKKRNSLY